MANANITGCVSNVGYFNHVDVVLLVMSCCWSGSYLHLTLILAAVFCFVFFADSRQIHAIQHSNYVIIS